MRGPDQFPWTDEQVETLRRLHADGLSFGRIAADLGCPSRNAVIGKARRIGLPKGERLTARQPTETIDRSAPRRKTPFRAPPARGASVTTPAVSVTMVGAAPSKSGTRSPVSVTHADDGVTSPFACTLMDLRLDTCRWPLGEPQGAQSMFCGASVTHGAYCARHGAMAYMRLVRAPAGTVWLAARQRRRAHAQKLARAG